VCGCHISARIKNHVVTLTCFQLHVHRATRIADNKNQVPTLEAFTFIIVISIVKLNHFTVSFT